jgi:hypothetical protein
MIDYQQKYTQGLTYDAFLAQHGTDEHRRRWAAAREEIRLSPAQRELLASFKREMKLVCLAGAWCGDCVYQCPIFDHIERASPVVEVRYFDRDAHADLADALSICGGKRVPVLVMLNEDFQEVDRYGDRTLARYRKLAELQIGPSCPTGKVLPTGDELSAIVTDWFNEIERAQLLLRLSPRLRAKHGD